LKSIITGAISVLNKTERSKLLLQILSNAFVSIVDIGSLALLLLLVKFYSQHGSTGTTAASRILLQLQQQHYLLPLALFLVFFILKNLMSYLAIRAQFSFIYSVASRISRRNLLRYLNGSYANYTQVNPAAHVSTISYQPTEFSTYILAGIQQMFAELILTSTAIVAILLFNARLFVLLLLILLPPVIIASIFSRRRLNAARASVKESAETATQHLHEALGGFIEANVFSRQRFFTNRYAGSHQRLLSTLSQLQIAQALPARFVEVFAVFGLLSLILVNRYTGSASMELVNIGAFIGAAYKIIPGITRMANAGAQMRMYAHTTGNVGREEEPDLRRARTEQIDSIRFRDVSFRHDQHGSLLHFDWNVERGDFVGISSDSGKGKTTMINLLLGFLKPDEGSIYINGEAVNPERLKDYWQDISYVKQHSFLIHDTILKNITLEDEEHDSEALEQAVRMAGLEAFIASFPEGLEKVITDSGRNISGGQRQRIALARAFYRNRSLLILDEPFSELDAPSEQAILEQLQSLRTAGKIILFITHNKRSLQFCSKSIIVDG
jgi:ABC-type multidrug transport system fused ATPase/permease subunit